MKVPNTLLVLNILYVAYTSPHGLRSTDFHWYGCANEVPLSHPQAFRRVRRRQDGGGSGSGSGSVAVVAVAVAQSLEGRGRGVR